jgi:hypothetical protein
MDINLRTLIHKSPQVAREYTGEGRTPCPPMWVLDKLAEEKLTGGFDTGRGNICPRCYMARCSNGSCNCDL